MTDYTELVKALRHCGKDLMHGERCKDSCPYGDIALCLPKLKLDAASAIEALQAQLPKRGEWEDYNGHKNRIFKCSVCGSWDFGKYRYCHVCGAKMEVQE